MGLKKTQISKLKYVAQYLMEFKQFLREKSQVEEEITTVLVKNLDWYRLVASCL
jgi:hypothetical protein